MFKRTQQRNISAFVKPSSGCILKGPQYTVGNDLKLRDFVYKQQMYFNISH